MDQQNMTPEVSKGNENSISSVAGIVIILLVVVIIGLLVWKFQSNLNDISATPASVTQPAAKKTPATNAPSNATEGVVPSNATTGTTTSTTTTTTTTATQVPVNFDKELKDLDTAAGAVNATDFGDSGLSNTELGL